MKIKFSGIDHIILFGGSFLFTELAILLKKEAKYSLTCFSCERQLSEVLYDSKTLETILKEHDISCYSSEDLCQDERIPDLVSHTTLGIGLGEAWSFDKKTITRFGGRLLDFMGIRLPRYRGGAHYSWQIMRKNKIGCCNLQIINEDMIQGVFDSGEIVKSKEYFFPPAARIPQDYFAAAVKEEMDFLKEFLREVGENKEFELTKIQENFSVYFPRLYTLKHGFVNFNWKLDDIVTFISAFDDPYPGASTFIDGKRVFLKDVYAEFDDGHFHPFQAGLIYKKTKEAIFVATLDGTLVIRKIFDKESNDLIDTLKVGQRLFTPSQVLEESMLFSAFYDAKGVKE